MKNVEEALQSELKDLIKAAEVLSYSLDKCTNIRVRADMSFEELDSFEALTARFARLSDIVTQKVLRYFDVIDLEDAGTVRDRINRSEKKELITSAKDMIEIRSLRNEIAHEYKPDTIYAIFERVLALTPVLLENVGLIISKSKNYC